MDQLMLDLSSTVGHIRSVRNVLEKLERDIEEQQVGNGLKKLERNAEDEVMNPRHKLQDGEPAPERS